MTEDEIKELDGVVGPDTQASIRMAHAVAKELEEEEARLIVQYRLMRYMRNDQKVQTIVSNLKQNRMMQGYLKGRYEYSSRT